MNGVTVRNSRDIAAIAALREEIARLRYALAEIAATPAGSGPVADHLGNIAHQALSKGHELIILVANNEDGLVYRPIKTEVSVREQE